MPDKDFKVRISAQDDGFGSTLRKAKADLDAALNVGGSFASALTGGVLGGGVMGVLMMAVDRITTMVQETARLAKIAQDISVSRNVTRSIAHRATALGANDNSVFSSVDSAAKARADALAGEPTAIAAFERINVSLEKIKNLSPDELFFQIAESFKGLQLDAEKVVASRRILGASADELMPFFVAGSSFRMKQSEIGANTFHQPETGSDFFKRFWSVWVKGGTNPFKADLDPVSTYPLEREQATMRLRENNSLRAEAIARSQLSAEEQISDLVRQRLEINRLIELESSEFRKEQLRSRILDVEEQRIRLQMAIDKDGQRMKNAANGVLQTRNLDELYKSGIFTGGRPMDLQATSVQQLQELKTLVRATNEIPRKIAQEL